MALTVIFSNCQSIYVFKWKPILVSSKTQLLILSRVICMPSKHFHLHMVCIQTPEENEKPEDRDLVNSARVGNLTILSFLWVFWQKLSVTENKKSHTIHCCYLQWQKAKKPREMALGDSVLPYWPSQAELRILIENPDNLEDFCFIFSEWSFWFSLTLFTLSRSHARYLTTAVFYG